MPKRVDAEDTVDTAIHFLHKLQAEGWAVKSLAWDVDHHPVGKRRLPVEATVTVKLQPARP